MTTVYDFLYGEPDIEIPFDREEKEILRLAVLEGRAYVSQRWAGGVPKAVRYYPKYVAHQNKELLEQGKIIF